MEIGTVGNYASLYYKFWMYIRDASDIIIFPHQFHNVKYIFIQGSLSSHHLLLPIAHHNIAHVFIPRLLPFLSGGEYFIEIMPWIYGALALICA